MHNNISLDIDHPAATRASFFLNHINESLIEVPMEWQAWKMSDHMSGGGKFKSTGENPVTITVLLCDSYHDGNEIAKANKLLVTSYAKWGVNGDILYYVEGEDTDKISTILSLFAGEE